MNKKALIPIIIAIVTSLLGVLAPIVTAIRKRKQQEEARYRGMSYPGSRYDRSHAQGDPYARYRDGEAERRRKSGLLWGVVIALLVAGVVFFLLLRR